MAVIEAATRKRLSSDLNGQPASHRPRRDNLTPVQRSYTMARIKGRGTTLERLVMGALRRRGLRFRTHVSTLPGRPDIVFLRERLAVFLDGDFWHGYRLPLWRHTLSDFWQTKISATRKRDRRNLATLRRRGWTVIRVWQHEVKRDLQSAVDRIVDALQMQGTDAGRLAARRTARS